MAGMGPVLDWALDDLPLSEFFSKEPVPFADEGAMEALIALEPNLRLPLPDEATKKRIAEHDSDNSEEEETWRSSARDAKRAKATETNQAARNKATREKARRERINESFAKLSKLIDPDSKEPKTDKLTILSDAIKWMQQLRAENHQLKQLNKHLEDKIGQDQRTQHWSTFMQMQQMRQQEQLMQQLQQGQMMPGLMAPGMMPPGAMPNSSMPGSSSMHASAAGPSNQPLIDPAAAAAAAAVAAAQQPAQHQPAGPGPSSCLPAGSVPQASTYSSMLQGAGVPAVPLSRAASCVPPAPGDVKFDPETVGMGVGALPVGLAPGVTGAKGLMGMQQAAAQYGYPQMMAGFLPPVPPAGPQGSSWPPANMLDSSQDSMLRPPAA